MLIFLFVNRFVFIELSKQSLCTCSIGERFYVRCVCVCVNSPIDVRFSRTLNDSQALNKRMNSTMGSMERDGNDLDGDWKSTNIKNNSKINTVWRVRARACLRVCVYLAAATTQYSNVCILSVVSKYLQYNMYTQQSKNH